MSPKQQFHIQSKKMLLIWRLEVSWVLKYLQQHLTAFVREQLHAHTQKRQILRDGILGSKTLLHCAHE